MIPLRLEFQAFGSYVNRQIVDFTRFQKGELFLINGKTGSGKTTIIDAMVFALYGSGSGEDRNSLEQMRSFAYGAEKIPTEIAFTFEAKGKTYKFERKCYTREKKKRDGTIEMVTETDHNAFELVGEIFVPCFENPKISAVNDLAEQIIGLNKDQFTKVMVLPQGKFESFLVADSKEKEEILCTLFNVEKWKKIADFLCKNALSMLEEAKELKIICENILKRYDCENIGELSQLNEHQKTRLKELDGEITKIKETALSLKTEKEKLLLVAKAFSELEEAVKRLDELSMQKESFSKLGEEIKKNKVANEIKPYADFCRQYNDELKKRIEQHKNAENAVKTAALKLEEAKLKREEIANREQLFEEKNQLLSKMKNSRDSYENLAKTRENLAETESRIESLKKQRDLCTKSLEAVKSGVLQLEEQQKVLTSQLSRLTELTKIKSEINEISEITKNVKEAEQKLQEKLGHNELLVSEIEAVKSQYENIKQLRDEKYHTHISNLAFTLAENLKDGEACPVCGSVHHPSPAKSNGNTVSVEEIKKLDAELEGARTKLSNIENSKSAVENEIKILEATISENKGKLSAMKKYSTEEIARINADFEASETAGEHLAQLDKEFARLKNDREKSRTELDNVNEKLTEQEKSHAFLKATTEALSNEISKIGLENVGNIAQLDEKIHETEDEITKFSQMKLFAEKNLNDANALKISSEKALETSENEVNTAKTAYDEAVKNYTEIMQVKGFASRNEYESFITDENNIALKEAQLEVFKHDLALWEQRVKELSENTKNTEKPNISQLDEQIKQVDEVTEKLLSESAALVEKSNELTKFVSEYNENFAKYEKLREDGDRLVRFGKDLRGDNSIGLRRFVLGVMLEKVIFEANSILRELKGGQFSLVVNREKQGLKHQFGLDLFVESTKTERPYSVKYLSGGEKFLVAMALSLALSSIVQMTAGGISIDALFIDEGFGSLDPTSLDEAMQVLSTMSGNRRIMGIISHVDVLKDAIQKKIDVVNDAQGSRLSLNF